MFVCASGVGCDLRTRVRASYVPTHGDETAMNEAPGDYFGDCGDSEPGVGEQNVKDFPKGIGGVRVEYQRQGTRANAGAT